MKWVCICILFASVSFGALGQQSWIGGTSLPFTLSLGFNRDAASPDDSASRTIKVGSDITLRIRKTNITDHAIKRLGPENGAFGCTFEVRDSKGNPAHPHKSTDKWIRGGGPSFADEPNEMGLKPGESIVDYLPVSSWFDLTQPDTYTIQVSQHASNNPKSAVVKSNKITVTITP